MTVDAENTSATDETDGARRDVLVVYADTASPSTIGSLARQARDVRVVALGDRDDTVDGGLVDAVVLDDDRTRAARLAADLVTRELHLRVGLAVVADPCDGSTPESELDGIVVLDVERHDGLVVAWLGRGEATGAQTSRLLDALAAASSVSSPMSRTKRDGAARGTAAGRTGKNGIGRRSHHGSARSKTSSKAPARGKTKSNRRQGPTRRRGLRRQMKRFRRGVRKSLRLARIPLAVIVLVGLGVLGHIATHDIAATCLIVVLVLAHSVLIAGMLRIRGLARSARARASEAAADVRAQRQMLHKMNREVGTTRNDVIRLGRAAGITAAQVAEILTIHAQRASSSPAGLHEESHGG